MPVSTVLAVLLTAQTASPAPAPTPAPAQTPTPAPTPNPAGEQIQTTARAFSACLGPKVPAVAPTLTPEQGADSVLAACKTEQTALEQAVEAMIATAPADKQADARKQLSDGMAQARTQIADGIRQMRAATPPAPPK